MRSSLLTSPRRPFVAILGGAKISDKFHVIGNLLTTSTFSSWAADGQHVPPRRGRRHRRKPSEPDRVAEAGRLLQAAYETRVRVVLPIDVRIGRTLTPEPRFGPVGRTTCPMDGTSWTSVRKPWGIGAVIAAAQTVFWNGPVGMFELPAFADGTGGVARLLAEASNRGANVVVGGGGSLAAVAGNGLSSRMTHLSTGGGASLEFLEGKVLPGIAMLQRGAAAA